MTLPCRQKYFSRTSWVFLIGMLYVVLGGAFVRATSSGAGCGSHWPLCNGNILPDFSLIHTIIEYTHRISSGLVGVFGFLLWVSCFFCFPKGHIVRRAGSGMLISLLLEILLGAALVKLELVGMNSSLFRAVFMSLHLVVTFILLASIALTAAWSGTLFSKPQHVFFRHNTKKIAGIVLCVIGLMAVGVSGAITALGDTLFHPQYVGEGFVEDLSSPGVHFLKSLRIYHPVLAVLMGSFLVYFVSYLKRCSASHLAEKMAYAVYFLFCLQLLCGFINVLLLAPVYMQIVHLLIGDMLWLAAILFFNESLSDARFSNRHRQ